MAEDWSIDVKKFVPDADDDIIAGLVRYCGIALRNRDSSLVSFSDAVETDRVKANFLRKKLGLTDADAVLDAAIAAVGDRMKADRTKNRVTVYYLLASHFGRLEDFRPKAKARPAKAAAEAELPLAAAALPAEAPAAAAEPVMAPPPPPPAPPAPPPPPVVPTPVLAAAPAAVAAPSMPPAPAKARLGLFWPLAFLLISFAGIAAIILLGSSKAAAPARSPAALPAAAPAAIPDGAGLVSEDRDGQPVLVVYFAVGKADVAPGFADKAAAVKAWAASHAGSKYVISGYNDPTGNAAANAELSKNRAQAVQAALVASGVAAADTMLEKPPETTDAQVTAAQARRVEVIVR